MFLPRYVWPSTTAALYGAKSAKATSGRNIIAAARELLLTSRNIAGIMMRKAMRSMRTQPSLSARMPPKYVMTAPSAKSIVSAMLPVAAAVPSTLMK